MSVTEYERRFNQLSRYTLYLVDTEGMGSQITKKGKPKGSSALVQKTFPQCPTYGKHHRGECLAGKNVCYRSGDPGHIIYDCSKRNARDSQRTATLAQDKK